MEAVIKTRKSVVLTKEEWKTLKAAVEKCPTVVEYAEHIGIHRNVLDRVLVVGSGSVETIGKIRAVINPALELSVSH